jgi:hypothetical protein
MSDRRRLLMRSSENLSQLIQLALMHEENINNEYTERRGSRIQQTRGRPNYEVHSYEFSLADILERYIDASYNRRTTYDSSGTVFDVSSIEHLLTYTQYNNIINPLNTSCAITHDEFNENDEVIMINECRHIFKRNSLINWLRFRQTCPCCRINLR